MFIDKRLATEPKEGSINNFSVDSVGSVAIQTA